MFTELFEVLKSCDINMNIGRNGDLITVSIIPLIKNTNKEDAPLVSPALITATAEELDEHWDETIDSWSKKVVQPVANTAYQLHTLKKISEAKQVTVEAKIGNKDNAKTPEAKKQEAAGQKSLL